MRATPKGVRPRPTSSALALLAVCASAHADVAVPKPTPRDDSTLVRKGYGGCSASTSVGAYALRGRVTALSVRDTLEHAMTIELDGKRTEGEVVLSSDIPLPFSKGEYITYKAASRSVPFGWAAEVAIKDNKGRLLMGCIADSDSQIDDFSVAVGPAMPNGRVYYAVISHHGKTAVVDLFSLRRLVTDDGVWLVSGGFIDRVGDGKLSPRWSIVRVR
jgi:hypothetical protein